MHNFPIFLVLLLTACTLTTSHLYSRVRPSHVKTRDTYTVLESRKNADGTIHERIQEHAKELPELPLFYEEDPPLAGKVNDDGSILVPVDADGNVLPGYEHLLQPNVYQMTREEIDKLNNTGVGKQVPPKLQEGEPLYHPEEHIENEDEILRGSDYDDSFVPDSKLPAPNADYFNSKEVDDLIDEEMDDLLVGEKLLEKAENTGIFVNHIDDVRKEEKEIDMLEKEIKDREKENTEDDSTKELNEDVLRIKEDASENLEKMRDIEQALDELFAEGSETKPRTEVEAEKSAEKDHVHVPKAEEPVKPIYKVLSKEDSWEQEEKSPEKPILRTGRIGGEKTRKRPDSSKNLKFLFTFIFTLLFVYN